MSKALLLTLGHGSSAILIENNVILCGYQEERLTKIKSDSAFPGNAIEEIRKFHPLEPNIDIYVSHWEPTGNVNRMSNKHWEKNYIKQKFPLSQIKSVNTSTTHHDAHAYSAIAYNIQCDNTWHIMVADGFGTAGEVLSIYRVMDNIPVLIKRVFGYENSLGLLYQYATDYVGLKQNQDEYKLNAMANLVKEEDVHSLEKLAIEYAEEILVRSAQRQLESPDDPIYALGALSYVHKTIVDYLGEYFYPSDRPEIAYWLQCVVRYVFEHYINHHGITNLTLAGGCFLNVQLNGELMDVVPGQISIMPLSGDEGAALGLYKKYNPGFVIPNGLHWGTRRLYKIDYESPRLLYTRDKAKTVLEYLKQGKIVNIITDKMEFGPRAYCYTSTLALPTVENRTYINRMNGRDDCMPMCPVIRDVDVCKYFDIEADKIQRSIEHMIIAVKCRPICKEKIPGATYTRQDGVLTARPQVINNHHWLYKVLNETGPLINTSFNNHGCPICLSMEDIFRTHIFMIANDDDERIVTIIDAK